MLSTNDPISQLQHWRTVLSDHPRIGPEQPGRELWPVTAGDGREYLLKRLGPWRNLPVADEARVLAHLARSGLRVAEFVITDHARLYSGEVEDSFVLLPHLAHDQIRRRESLPTEAFVGGSVARLHQSLATYPWNANSYRERIVEGLSGRLLLPDDVRDQLEQRGAGLIKHLGPLDLQLVHGDLTPDNVLVSRDERTVAFIDFDHLPLAPRVWDIGKYLSRRMRRLEPTAALENVSQFVAGYHRTSTLTERAIGDPCGHRRHESARSVLEHEHPLRAPRTPTSTGAEGRAQTASQVVALAVPVRESARCGGQIADCRPVSS